jgi:hypothetical protein
MSVLLASRTAVPPHLRARAALIPIAVALAGSAVLAGVVLADPRGGIRVVLMLAAATFLAGLGFLAPHTMLYVLFAWLAGLGLFRRLVDSIAPDVASDPLLLVGPLAIVALLSVALNSREPLRRTPLTLAVFALTAFVLLGALNPMQGGLEVGVTGLLFMLVPLLGFWVGRALCDDRTLTTLLMVVAVLAVPAAVYGLVQSFRGFPAWDQSWIEQSGYIALHVGGQATDDVSIRPFSSFTAAHDYLLFVAIGMLAWLAFWMRRARALVGIGVAGLLGIAVFYGSSRGVVILVVLAVALMLSAWLRLGALRSAALAAAAVLVLPIVVQRLPLSSDSSPLVAHQVEGLANPLNSETSTAQIHLELIEEGLRSGLANPLGHGTGAVTLASTKLEGTDRGTEADPSNVAAALGIPGLLAYLAVVVFGFRRALVRARLRRDALSIVVVGLLTVTLLQWLNGGLYAVSLLPWLALGWLDREESDEAEPSAGEAQED